MATYGTNVGIKVSAVVQRTSTHGAGSIPTTLYTVPANSYAIITSWFLNTNNASTTNMVIAYTDAIIATGTPNVGVKDVFSTLIYLGPGDVITFNSTGNGGTAKIQGVEYSNT